MKKRRLLANFSIVFLVLGLSLGFFGATSAGSPQFDEMAGIIPYLAIAASIVFLITAVLLLIIMIFRSIKSGRQN